MMLTKFLLLAVFGIAMAHLEGVVVVYLRQVLGLLDPDLQLKSLEGVPPRYLFIEKTREVATIIMLAALALLVGTTWLDKLVVFLWTFAIWDLFYYLSLYFLIKWPPNLKTLDVLFLIPRPWIAPVWLPIGISTLTILIIAVSYIRMT
jgi:hypothetical protein